MGSLFHEASNMNFSSGINSKPDAGVESGRDAIRIEGDWTERFEWGEMDLSS